MGGLMVESSYLAGQETQLVTEVDDLVKQTLVDAFWVNYNIVEGKKYIIYPRKTFKRRKIPTPRQYIAFNGLFRLLGEESNIKSSKELFAKLPTEVIDLATDHILLVDKFSSLFTDTGKKYKITLTSGFFWHNMDTDTRRKKMIGFLKELAWQGTEIYIYTQYDRLSHEMSDDGNVPKNISISSRDDRIDIHYIVIENKNDPEDIFFLLEYPHTELVTIRLNVYFTAAEIKKRFNVDPQKVLEYLTGLIKGFMPERIYSFITKKVPNLDKVSPDFGLVINKYSVKLV
jgi:hypothetical protein